MMEVEIWSDIVCPFCYIGKRKLENAMNTLPFKDKIKIHWKSYQLNPSLQVEKGVDAYDILAKKKGQTREWAIEMYSNIQEAGKEVGIDFNFVNAIPVNTFEAHRFAQLAKSVGKGNEAEELLFKAYFTDGKDLGDIEILQNIGKQLGIEEESLATLFSTDIFSGEVQRDLYEAEQIRIQGVPFFVFDRKYAVSGAQDVSVFTQTLEKSFQEWLEKNPSDDLQIIEGKVCRIDGTCD